jgi:hypothetical protein
MEHPSTWEPLVMVLLSYNSINGLAFYWWATPLPTTNYQGAKETGLQFIGQFERGKKIFFDWATIIKDLIGLSV